MSANLIAFDIGESQAKLVWYVGNSKKKAVCAQLPDNLVSNGEIISMDAMADFLKDIAKQNGIPRGAAAVILPSSLVFTRNVDVPAMTDAQLAYNLPFEFKDYLTQEKSRYFFDYAVQSTEKGDDGAINQMHLFACATLKETVEDYREMFRRAGFKLKYAIPEEAAYAALLDPNGSTDGSDTCFVDVGYNAIRMLIYRGDVFVTRRTIDLGLRDVVQSLADTRGIDAHMAHEHLLSDYDDALTCDGSLEIYHNMAAEIMKAVNFYNYNNREQTLRCIYLCGGGAAIEPLRNAVAELTGMEMRSAAKLMPNGVAMKEPWLYVKSIGCAEQC